jgi:hypothetical protein
MEIVYLTPKQEVKVLEMCKDNFIGNGSSRAVYKLNTPNGVYAVKVFLDKGGHIQSLAELRLYECLAEDNTLAQIYAFGKTCLICEWIDYVYEDYIEDFITDRVNEQYWEGEFSSLITDHISLENAYAQVNFIHYRLTEYCGDTGDNTQIGWSPSRKRFVAYDYGYNTDVSRREQVGHMSDYLGNHGQNEVLQEAHHIVESLSYEFIDHYDDENYYEDEDCEDCDSTIVSTDRLLWGD